MNTAQTAVTFAPHDVEISRATRADLDAINRVIAGAVETWPVPARLKRLSASVLGYRDDDLASMAMAVARVDGHVVGVAAWAHDQVVDGKSATLLHGLFVDGSCQRLGIGRQLHRVAAADAAATGSAGLLVRAERVSQSYFEREGFLRLPASREPGASYPYRFWCPLDEQASGTAA